MARGLNNMGAINVMVILIGAALLQGSLAQTTHVVGDSLGWLDPPGGAAAYSTWAATQNFNVGDVLVFNFATGNHDVAKVTKAAFDSCNSANPISLSTTGPTTITLSSAGEHFFFCTIGQHCTGGQKLAINVSTATAPTPPPTAEPSPPPTAAPSPPPTAAPSPPPAAATPAPTPSPVSTPPPSPSPSPVATPSPTPSPVTAPAPGPSAGGEMFVVGDALGWIVPPGGAAVYQAWAANNTFNVGDTLVFNFMPGAHTVAEVSKTAFNSCDTAAATNPISTSPARITLTTPGEHFYICTIPTHCSRGQLLAINVTGAASTPSPSGSTTPPPSGSTTPPPSGTVSPPPPEGSAASFTIAALPVTLLSIAMALLY